MLKSTVTLSASHDVENELPEDTVDSERERLEAVAQLNYNWLSDRGLNFADMWFDNEGDAYVLEEGEEETKKIYLPKFTNEEADKWLKDNQ